MKPSLSLNRRGAVAATIAVLAIVLIGCVGLAVDMTRAYMVSGRLKTAVDAAALYAAREIDTTQATRDARVTELFWVNYRANRAASAGSYIGSTPAAPTITALDANRIQISGSATVNTTLFNVIGRRTMTVNAVTIAQRQGSGLEIALVIDQTSSMRGAKLTAVQDAVSSLLDILYAGADTQQNLWVSVVPFSRSINIGTSAEAQAIINTSGLPTSGLAPWSVSNWSGCVEARYAGGYDLTDDAPTTSATQFRPFFWPSTYRAVGSRPNDTTNRTGQYCTSTNSYPLQSGDSVRYCFGDNDWRANPTSTQTTLLNTNPSINYLRGQGMAQADVSGPNFLCALTPLLPLTASRAAVQARVDAITAPIKSGGTAIPPGLAGAWYTLSPNWQNVWPQTNPAGGPTLPLAYRTRNMNKAIVILTDGDNNWQPMDSYASGRVRANSTTTSGAQLFYSAYGRDSTWQANGLSPAISTAGSQTQGDAAMDSRLATLCTNIKNRGILIFVIGFEIATSAQRTMLQTCASGTGSPYFMEAPTTAELQNSFQTIARTLSSLRLAE